MPRKLILKEKQAYEGAKMFYYIFLPFLIIAFFIISLIQNTLNFALATFTILFYIVSLKFYRMCNKIENSPEN